MYGKPDTISIVGKKESLEEHGEFEPPQGPGYSEKKPQLDRAMLGVAQVRKFIEKGGTLEEIHTLKNSNSLFELDGRPPTMIAIFDNGQSQLYIKSQGKEYELLSQAEIDRLLLGHKCNEHDEHDCSGGREQLEKLVSGYGRKPFVYRKGMVDDSGTGDLF